MNLERVLGGPLGRIPPAVAERIFGVLRRVPAVQRRIVAEYEAMLESIRPVVKPYADERPPLTSLPTEGRGRAAVLDEIRSHAEREAPAWAGGQVSGAVYHGDPDHLAFLDEVLSLTSQTNPLHADVWPSIARYEAEIVAMTASMLGAGPAGADEICGTVTSGGTESIVLAVKAYRDRAEGGRVGRPQIVAPDTAHTAFDKAGALLGVDVVRIPVDGDSRAQVDAVADAVNRRTILIVGSAPSFPHGTIDPIEDLAGLALERGVGLHVDACLGGFVLPWAERLGYPVPAFDFRVPGVTSMSADTHKYGYAPKGTSVVLYRGRELRRHQYFTATEWPGGLYFSPTLAGSRPGSLSAGAWAVMASLGEAGYLDAARRILETGEAIRAGIEAIPELEVIGEPLWVIAFRSEVVDVYRVLDAMSAKGWSLNGLHRPPAVHLAVTLRHTQPGVAEGFLTDLADAVAEVRDAPPSPGGMAPVYGLAATVPVRTMVGDLLERYLDLLYEP